MKVKITGIQSIIIFWVGSGGAGGDDWCSFSCPTGDIIRVHCLGDDWHWNENEGITTGRAIAHVLYREAPIGWVAPIGWGDSMPENNMTDPRAQLQSVWRETIWCSCVSKIKRKRKIFYEEEDRFKVGTVIDIYKLTGLGYHTNHTAIQLV